MLSASLFFDSRGILRKISNEYFEIKRASRDEPRYIWCITVACLPLQITMRTGQHPIDWCLFLKHKKQAFLLKEIKTFADGTN